MKSLVEDQPVRNVSVVVDLLFALSVLAYSKYAELDFGLVIYETGQLGEFNVILL